MDGNRNPSRRRHAAAYWKKVVSEHASSGLTQRAFCEKKELCLSSFHRWKKRLGDQEPMSIDASWLELPLPPTEQVEGWEVELDLGGGICLRLRRR